jgi:hypothetical protein
MNDRAVPDVYVVPDGCRRFLISTMDDRAILDIDPVADPDEMDVASDHRVKPDAAAVTHHHVADDRRIGSEKTIVSGNRSLAVEGEDQCHSSEWVSRIFRKFNRSFPMTLNRISILLFFLGLGTLAACKKQETYSLVPAIEYKSIFRAPATTGFDSAVVVTISFTDGDGDIGYYPVGDSRNDPKFDDVNSQYYNNYVVKTYILESGVWQADPINVSARLPYMTPEGSNKALRGDIQRTLTLPPALNNDTLKYEVYIWDRALNRSNIITTDAIVLRTQ